MRYFLSFDLRRESVTYSQRSIAQTVSFQNSIYVDEITLPSHTVAIAFSILYLLCSYVYQGKVWLRLFKMKIHNII